MAVPLDIDTSELDKFFRNLTTLALLDAIEPEINAEMQEFRTFMIQEHLSGGTTPTKLARRSSNLANSLVVTTERSASEIKSRAHFLPTALDYAAIHEYGGVIKAKNAPFLMFKVDGQWVRTLQVTIPPRMHLRDEFGAWESKFGKAIDRGIEKALSNV